MEQALEHIQLLLQDWQKKLPEFTVVLGGSLVSGLFVQEGAHSIDVDVRFLSDNPSLEEVAFIETETGLRFRKAISVNDWPKGQSQGFLIEGSMTIPGINLPLDIEGCLRNKKYVGWGKFYPVVLSSAELQDIRSQKIKLRNNKQAYKQLKLQVLDEVKRRCIERGLVHDGIWKCK